MSSKTLMIILILLTIFIVFCIYSIVKIHDRAIRLSKSENVKDYIAGEKKRLEKAKRQIAMEERELENLQATKNIEDEESHSAPVEEEDVVQENVELAEELEKLREELN